MFPPFKPSKPQKPSHPSPSKASNSSPSSSGQLAEQAAKVHLESQGLQWVNSNYRCKMGEIDLIMLDGNTLVFVEVRLRKRNHFATALESITPRKQQKIIKAAHRFLSQHPHFQHHNCRFDVIGMDYTSNKPCNIEWITSAFDAY
ncbi:YraN family protein [Marinibactrum halimedae]|uniref:UPF0102 protein GCM10007877_21000 n=1 Tax=Marinibactrum halimedae TaxID=1444977 RepID=A0AA37T429_9GAMM|nr:YraN family protein [Marinibactrum halimedae]MCD9460145.1 YraN family protein [Marinibactrum halimedae]GLS26385.1 UPF0102 protein [Marinibactrum halimedae]